MPEVVADQRIPRIVGAMLAHATEALAGWPSDQKVEARMSTPDQEIPARSVKQRNVGLKGLGIREVGSIRGLEIAVDINRSNHLKACQLGAKSEPTTT